MILDNNNGIEYYDLLNQARIQTVAEWERILKHEIEEHRGFDFVSKVLIEMYKTPNYTIFCREFEKQQNIGGLNLRVGEFRDRIRKLDGINFPAQIRDDTKTDRAWNIPFKTSEEINSKKENTGKFCWILREELIEALENVMPYLKEYRREFSNQYSTIEYYDNSIMNKSVEYIDSQIILNNALSQVSIEEKNRTSSKITPKKDYIKKQIRNKIIGDSGEKKVVQQEKERLLKAGKTNLAQKVHIVDSDAYGYDVESFDENGNPKHIEVKTSTSSSNDICFYISAHEVEVAKMDDAYELHYLYCVKEKILKTIIFSNQQLKFDIFKNHIKPVQYMIDIKNDS